MRISASNSSSLCQEIGLTVTSSIKGLLSITKVTSLSVMLCPLWSGCVSSCKSREECCTK
ncbi:Uncharacterised protein [Vibrio cholerae]|nr:Uncharacterised protein [Vibrio cholerae]